jgi:hypothetical protein
MGTGQVLLNFGQSTKETNRSPVGASLLAKAVFHSTLMLNMTASSRASSLPQGFASGYKVW